LLHQGAGVITRSIAHAAVLAIVCIAGCGSDSGAPVAVQSEADARAAYLGLDASVDKAIALGFDGFNSASSANIAPQTARGTVAGTMTVTGKVDQGASANKGMRLALELAAYSDVADYVYDTTAGALPALNIDLKGIPTGTLGGSLVGAFTMSGTQKGSVVLNLSFTGQLEAGTGTSVKRKAGTTHITGTAQSPAGTYAVDVTR
jgi:hypothetical protein